MVKKNLHKLPADMLSIIAFYLTHYEIAKLSSSSLYFNQASNLHYKAVCLKEENRRLPVDQKNVNWKIEFAKTQSLKCFSVPTTNLKLDPHEPGSVFQVIPNFAPAIKSLPAIKVKSIEQIAPKMSAILTEDSRLLIVNSDNIESVL